jgi:hypothetical protein
MNAQEILQILDACCDAYTFPMLDNGYVYLAATRMSLYRAPPDWALVIEIFGFSPRAGLPDTQVATFGSRLHMRDPVEKYVSAVAHARYLENNPFNESRWVYPLEEGAWQDAETPELLAEDAESLLVRGQPRRLPGPEAYAQRGITLEQPPRIAVFELCRYLAEVERDLVLATSGERRVSVPPDMAEVLRLEEWHHPNVVDDSARPSGSRTFQQLAQVLATGNVGAYRPLDPPNTHWKHWPDGGTL